MERTSTKPAVSHSGTGANAQLFEDWFDPIESRVRDQVRHFIEGLIEAELEEALARPRYRHQAKAGDVTGEGVSAVSGHRHGHRSRSLTGTFGPVQIKVPRARLKTADGKTTEWKSRVLPVYQRRTKAADALIAGAYLSGTNTRRVRRALATLFRGTVSKDTVSRVWRKVEGDWKTWNARSLTDEPIVRLILDGTVVRVRLDRQATSISLLIVLGVRQDGQKVLLAVKSVGGETAEAWRAVLDDLLKRGLRKPEFMIVDGGSGLDAALAAIWADVPTQRCSVHKHRNLLAHAPKRLHDEITSDYNDMIYANTAAEMRRNAERSCVSGDHATPLLPIASRRPGIAYSLSRNFHRASGRAPARPMRLSVCMRSSNDGSKPRRYCHRPKLQRCCSGHCSHRVRSSCARSMGGKRWQRNRPSLIDLLTSLPDQIDS
jgi:putative transposase